MSQPEAVGAEVAEELVEERYDPGSNEDPSLASAGAVAQSVVAKLAIVGLNALTGILSARALAPAGRGALSAMNLWPIFLGSALTFGMPSAITYHVRQNRERRSELLSAAMLIGLLSGIVGAIIGTIFLPRWIPQYSPETIFFARIFVWACPMQSLALIGRNALECQDDFTSSNKLLVVSPALTALALVVLILTHHMTPVTAACAYVVVGLLPTFWMFSQLSRNYSLRLRELGNSCKKLLQYGLASYGVDLCGAMALYVDQALVVRVLSPEAMGTYVVALSVSRMLNVFHTSVVMVLFPKSVGQDPGVVREMTGRATRMSTLLTAITGLCVIAVGPQVLTLLYSAQYRSAGPVLRVLVIEVVLAGATTVLSQAFMALGKPAIVTALQLLGLLLTVPMVLLLAPHYGIFGAALALLLSTTFRFIFIMVSFPIFLKLPPPSVIPNTKDFSDLLRMVRRRLASRTAAA